MSPPITFEPLPLRPRSLLELYIGAACMFTISFLSALLAVSYFYCPAHVCTFYSFLLYQLKQSKTYVAIRTHRLHGYAHCVKMSIINTLSLYSSL